MSGNYIPNFKGKSPGIPHKLIGRFSYVHAYSSNTFPNNKQPPHLFNSRQSESYLDMTKIIGYSCSQGWFASLH